MNKIMLLGAAALVAGCGAAAVSAAGDASRNFQVSGFDRLSVAGSTDVTVVTGKAASVRATGDAESLDRLEITVENNVLHVGTKRRLGGWLGGWKNYHAHVFVTVPMLRGAEVAGSADVGVDRVDTGDFAASVTGSGNVKIASLTAKTAQFEVTGSGDVTAAGDTQALSVKLSGSGDAHLGGLKSGSLTVSLRGSGNVGAFATRSAAISLAGSGDVTVRGGASCTKSKSGSGSINCG